MFQNVAFIQSQASVNLYFRKVIFNNMKAKLVFAGLLGIVAQSCLPSKSENEKANQLSSQEEIVKGEYLVTIMGCNDCHSPKVFTEYGPIPDKQRLLSGHPQDEELAEIDSNVATKWVLFGKHNTAVVGPWGVSFSANLTPDETGIKYWDFDNFKNAMTKGKSKGTEHGRTLLPPMPWMNYTKMKDEDLKAIFSYLKSIKPIKNNVPSPITTNQF